MTLEPGARVRSVAFVAAALAFAATACVDPRPLETGDSGIHPAGILDEHSEDFHGKELERRGWDLPLCATCHGEDFGGTTRAPSCKTCHQQGPTACDTCHPARPSSGAHLTHLDRAIACADCHAVPATWDSEGHVRRRDAADPAPAEVTMTGLAALTLEPADRTGPPGYDPATQTCGQVYCHGAVLGAAGGATTSPRWTDDQPGPAACSSCHGQPPPSHARSRCAECHPSGDRHLDGMVEVGDGSPGCSGCHGGPTSAAPPRDLAGNVASTAIGVGAHQAHLVGPRRLAAPIRCEACHVVPATVTAPGHIDSVDPAEVTASLGWDRTSQTCASAWCHGPGRPAWTSTLTVGCGSCHGVPPATAVHATATTIASCATCHGRSVDASGNILIVDGASPHMNGVVDAP